MKLIAFPRHNTVFAKDQPEYLPLPAYHFRDREGRIAFCWKLNWLERLAVLVTGKVWHQVLTFNQPLQPQQMTVTSPLPEYKMPAGEPMSPPLPPSAKAA